MLAPEYSIDGVELVMYGGHTRTITPLERAESGFGVSLNQAIKPPDKINVKVSAIHNVHVCMYIYMYMYCVCLKIEIIMILTCNYIVVNTCRLHMYM